MEDKLSKFLAGFRKNQSTHHCFVNILEKWKNTLDKGGFICSMLMDLSNVFDTMNYDLLIATLGLYGFQKDALSFPKKLFKEQTAIFVNSKFSIWKKIISGDPQDSLLGSLLY